MYYNRKKQLIKSGIIIIGILLIAIVSTYYIYYKFNDDHNIDYNSKSLDIIFHEPSGEKLTIDKVTPLTDSVGLSSKAYTLTIKNNLTEPVRYTIKVVDDIDQIINDNCEGYSISKENIRISIKENKNQNKIYNLNELENEILLAGKLKALEESNYSIRIWINKDTSLPSGKKLHYHGKIQVIENEKELAISNIKEG